MFYVTRRKKYARFTSNRVLGKCTCNFPNKTEDIYYSYNTFKYIDCRAGYNGYIEYLPVVLLTTKHTCSILQDVELSVDGSGAITYRNNLKKLQEHFSIKIWEF